MSERCSCDHSAMKRPFAATIWRESNWYVPQCLEIDIASQGATEDEASKISEKRSSFT